MRSKLAQRTFIRRLYGATALFAAVTLLASGSLVAWAVEARGATAQALLFAAALLTLAAGFGGLAWWITRDLVPPLRRLRHAARKIAAGDHSVAVPLSGFHELDVIAEACRSLARELSDLHWAQTQDRMRVATILERMQDGIVTLDGAGVITGMNPAAERILELRAKEAVGRGLLEATFNHELWRLFQNALRSGGVATMELGRPGHGSAVMDVFVTALEPTRPETNGAVMVLQDLTELRRLEDVRRDFVSNVSHELRTPIAAVRAMAETIVLRWKRNPEIGAEYAERILEESIRLGAMVDDLLHLAEVEAGRRRLSLSPVDLRDLLEGVVARARSLAEKTAVTLQVAEERLPSYALADAPLLAQAIYNLVENAIKYSGPEGQVTLAAERRGEEIVLAITDTGIGIPSPELPRVFERFYRVDRARSREAGGTGLGLSIVKHIAEVHGGRVWVESELGHGSRFYLALPVALTVDSVRPAGDLQLSLPVDGAAASSAETVSVTAAA